MRRGSRGVILLLAAGTVVLLLLLAMVLLHVARGAGRFSQGALASAGARLAAASGMDYAAARLAEHLFPVHAAGSASRGDDWRFREGPWGDLRFAHNPSYAHGEAWTDISARADETDNDRDALVDEMGEPDRIYVQGEPRGPDLDGDGGHTAWSGRVRGGSRPFDLTFSLCIEAADGRIPLNAGRLDAPACRDVRIPYHASLVQVLNNLGATLQKDGGYAISTRRWEIPTAGEPVLAAWLGFDLVSNRPAGGYRSWKEVERLLTVLTAAGGPYRSEELEAIRPFIDLGPHETLSESSRCGPDEVSVFPSYAPISFPAARRDVLRSVWMYLSAPSPATIYGPVGERYFRANDFHGETEGWSLTCPHSGLPFGPPTALADYSPATYPVMLTLHPDEADAIAEAAMVWRQGGGTDWEGLRGLLYESSMLLFGRDGDVFTAGTQTFRWSWLSSKAGLAYQAVTIDPYPYRGLHGGMETWATAGADGNLAVSGVQTPPVMGAEEIRGMLLPATFDPGNPAPWGSGPGDANRPYNDEQGKPFLRPQGFTMGPPVRFEVRSWGRMGGAGAEEILEGRFCAAERLELTSQEDFEILAGGKRLLQRGMIATGDPSPAVRHHCLNGDSAPLSVTLPAWNWRGLMDEESAVKAPCNGFSRVYGAVIPAPEPAGRGGSQLYWRMAQDFDGTEPAQTGDFWSENDPGFRINVGLPSEKIAPPYRLSPAFGGAEVPWPSRADHVRGSLAPFQCPGFDPPICQVPSGFDNNDLKEFAVDGWIGADAYIGIRLAFARLNDLPEKPYPEIVLEASRRWEGAPDRRGTLYRLTVSARGYAWNVLQKRPYSFAKDGKKGRIPNRQTRREWFVEDDLSRGAQGAQPFLLSMKRAGASVPGDPYRCVFTLHVGGARLSPDHEHWDPDPATPFPQNSGGIQLSSEEALSVKGVHDLRFYERERTIIQPRKRYQVDGRFTSPLYLCEGGAGIGRMQLHAQIPSTWTQSASVEVRGIGADGSTASKIVAGIADAARPFDLGWRGSRFRAFQYVVLLGGTDPLSEAPVFESIWLTLSRPGVAPAWSAWSSR